MTVGQEEQPNAATDSDYRAFLIRCWREGENWRFTLEEIGRTHPKRHGYAGFEQLAGYLEELFFNKNGAETNE